MQFPKFFILACVMVVFLGAPTGLAQVDVKTNQDPGPLMQNQTNPPYASVDDLIEVMFAQDSRVRLRNGAPVDLATNALTGVDGVLQKLSWFEWYRICDVPEERLDEIQAKGEANTGKPVYNLNNIYRLRIPKGLDVWAISKELEALPGIILARPVPKPMPLPNPPNYASCSGDTCQGYLRSGSSTPVGIDADYAWTQTGGNGAGVTVCDLEYGWNYNHADIIKAAGSQINPNPIFYPAGADTNHGTAVIGELVSDNNSWGTTGICYGSSLKTCGTVYNSSTNWDVPGAMAYAIAALSPGDVILLEQQWDYNYPAGGYIPIEWWLNYSSSPQSFNAVYAAIVNAVSNGINVVEAGGNGYVNTNYLTWYGNSGAIIVGAGGVYLWGTWPQGDLAKLDFSSFGRRFDLQGWGENVTTTGYGNLYSAQGYNYWYRKNFDGTSSASPIVAGAVACCVGYWKANISAIPPSPHYLRAVLINTGTPQVAPWVGWIGPRPDLRDAFTAFGSEWVNLTYPPLEDTTFSTGVACGDYDNDGDLDIYLANCGSPNKLFRNEGGGIFVDATSSPLDDPDCGCGVAWADYDNDGDLDLYVTICLTGNRLFRNEGGGSFVDATTGPLWDYPACGVAFSWGDFNNDGDLDIYLVNCDSTNKLFRNDGGGTFVDATSDPLGCPGENRAVSCADYDNDGDLDIYLVNGAMLPNKLFRNDGGLVFVDATSGPLGDLGSARGVDWGDYDNDGDLDIYFANYNEGNKLLRNDGGGTFVDVTTPVLADGGNPTNVAWADYDNDGDLDLFIAKVHSVFQGEIKLLRNDGNGVFVNATSGALADTGIWYGATLGDFDNDGDLDIYVANAGGSNRLLMNQKGSTNHWLHVNLVGIVSNRSAIGARVRAVSGSLSQIREISGGSGYYSQNSLTAEFGLGSMTLVDTLKIRWPSGIVQTLTAVPVDTLLVITESTFIRGDANGDGKINSADVSYLINYLFVGGPAPNPLWVGDANSDGNINSADAAYLINYLFVGGPAPDRR